MRQTIKGLIAALAAMTAGSAPAMACGFGGCCATVNPCATTYAPVYSYMPSYTYSSGCGTCGNSWGYERLAEPTTQYYYANQGPTYSGPGAFAPEPAYEEEALPAYTGYTAGYSGGYEAPMYGYGYHHHYRPYYHHYGYGYGYAARHYGYRYGYSPRHYAYRHWGNEGYYYGRPLVRRYY
jgi:hypothetical protein